MQATGLRQASLLEIAEACRAHDEFTICGHVNPDGDCIGSQLALRAALVQLGKDVHVLLAADAPLERSFACLPGADELVPAEAFDGRCEVFVQVDAPDAKRIGEAAAALRAQALFTITVDHHAVDRRETDLSYTDPDAASTSMQVWGLAGHLGVDRAGDVAA